MDRVVLSSVLLQASHLSADVLSGVQWATAMRESWKIVRKGIILADDQGGWLRVEILGGECRENNGS